MKLLGGKTHNEIWNQGMRKLQSRHCNPNRVIIASSKSESRHNPVMIG